MTAGKQNFYFIMLQAFTKRFCLLTVVMLLSVVNALAQVAQIGDKQYASLADAIAAVQANGEETTITMLANETVAEELTIATGMNITLELNGKTISEVCSKSGTSALITNKGTLTIQDNTDVNKDGSGTGKITYTNGNPDTQSIPGYASNTIINHGSLTLSSGYIENTTNGGYAAYTVDNVTNGNLYTPTFIMSGGKLFNSYTDAVRMFLNSTNNLNKVTISGGILDSDKASGRVVVMHMPSKALGKGELNIEGGSINGKVNAWSAANAGGVEDRFSDEQYANVKINITGGNIGSLSFAEMANTELRANSLVVTGGTYEVDPSAYVAEGYEAVKNNNDTWTVQEATAKVAQIGNVKYATLAEAIAAVPTDGTETTITMLADAAANTGVTIAANQNIVLELNGKVISVTTNSTKSYALITNKGTLTINDNTDTNKDGTGTGKITTTATDPDGQDWPGYASNTITNNGTLIINSGYIENSTTNGVAAYTVDNQTNGNLFTPTFTMNGGKLYNGYTDAIRQFLNSTTCLNKVVINGGVIASAKNGRIVVFQNSNAKLNKGELDITGGTILGNVGGWSAANNTYNFTDEQYDAISINISGGTMNAIVFADYMDNATLRAQAVVVTGGTYSVDPTTYVAEGYEAVNNNNGTWTVQKATYVAQIGSVKYATLAEAIAAATSGQTITLLADCETGSSYDISTPLKIAYTGTILDLNGKTLTVNNNFSFCVTASNVTVKNGTIASAENTAKATKLNSYILVIGGVEKDATISGVTIENVTTQGGISVGGSSDAAVKGIAANTVIKDCNVLSGDYYAVCSQNESTVTINGGQYTANTASSYSKVLQASFQGDDGPEGTISVVAGTFTGAIAASNQNLISITGGTYSVDPTAFVATGYEAVNNGDGTWTVKGSGEEFANDVKDENNNVVATETVTVNEEGEATITKVEIAQEGVKNVTVSAAIGSAEVTEIAADAFKSLANNTTVQTIDLSSTKVELSGSREGHAVLGDIPETALIYLPSTSSEVTGTNVVIKAADQEYTCADFKIVDKKDYSVPTPFTATKATFDREFVEGQYSTICLPFDVPKENIPGKIYSFTKVEGSNVIMTEETGDYLQANVPYILTPSKGEAIGETSNVTVQMDNAATLDANGTYSFIGVYEKYAFTADDYASGAVYGYAGQSTSTISAGTFVKFAGNSYVPGMRAYLKYTGGTSAAPGIDKAPANLPQRLNVILRSATGETTDILGLDLTTDESGAPVYNLSGQRVNNPEKGIYIKNGKKVIIK